MFRIAFFIIALLIGGTTQNAQAQTVSRGVILEGDLERTRSDESPRERRARQRDEIREARKDRTKKNREKRDTVRQFRETLKDRRQDRRDR